MFKKLSQCTTFITLGCTGWGDPCAVNEQGDHIHPAWPGLTAEQQQNCEACGDPNTQDCGETGGEQPSLSAWCHVGVDVRGLDPARGWCYPIEHGQPSEYYVETQCWAVFDYLIWNYDGTCDPGNGCHSSPTTARLCFGPDQADAVAGKPPGDKSIKTCWEDAIINGDLEPSVYLTMEYLDDQMHDPLCAPQVDVDEIGPLCVHDRGVQCLNHSVFCACICESDADCEAPSVCEGYTPGSIVPSFCVFSE